MKYFSLKANTKSIFNLFIMFVFIVMSSAALHGQSANKLVEGNSVEANSSSKKENVSGATSSNSMNFLLWFMGTKQDPTSIISKEGTNTKIQVITSGSAPNRLLIKAFLKKAVDSGSMIS